MKVVETKQYRFRGMAPVHRGDEFVTRDGRGNIMSIERVKSVHPENAETPHFINVEVLAPLDC